MLGVKPSSENDQAFGITDETELTGTTGTSPDPMVPIGRVSIIVLAKLPLPGRVKTRLCPPCTPAEAAQIAQAALQDTFASAISARTSHPHLIGDVVLCLERHGLPLPSWTAVADEVIDQCTGDLSDRLAHAFASVSGPAVLVGMDTPQVTADHFVRAVLTLHDPGTDSLIGAATDGGFWLIGFRSCPPAVFRDVPMSTGHTGEDQLRSMSREGLTPGLFTVLTDFDTFEDAVAITDGLHHLHTSAIVRRISEELRSTERIPVSERNQQTEQPVHSGRY